MVGYPKHLNTKEDYEYVRQNFPRDKWEPDFQSLLDTNKDWFFTGMLDKLEDGIEDDTHKIVNYNEGKEDEEPQYAQYEYKVNPMSTLNQIGYTEEEVRAILEN